MQNSEHARGSSEHLPQRRGYSRVTWAYWLLAFPVIGLLYPPLYARHDPTLGGFPFFYWYQLALVLAAGALTLLVHRLTKVGRGGEGA